MNSIILKTAVKYLFPILVLFSLFLLIRGHYEPGGGFVGGLVAASSVILYLITEGVEKTKRLMKFEPVYYVAGGLAISLLSGLVPVILGMPLLTGTWSNIEAPVLGKLGTPIVFDIGVYFLVLGVSTKIVISLAEED